MTALSCRVLGVFTGGSPKLLSRALPPAKAPTRSPTALGGLLYRGFLPQVCEAHVLRGLTPLPCLTWVLSQPLDSHPKCWRPHSPPHWARVPGEGPTTLAWLQKEAICRDGAWRLG